MVSKYLSVKQKKLIKQHKYILKKIMSSSQKDRNTILQNSPKELFSVLNILFKLLAKDEINLTRLQNKKIKKHKSLIRTISSLKGEVLKEKLIKHQRGVLKTVLNIISPIIESSHLS